MTHLVEMQQEQAKFDAAGLKLYAISYDEPEALAEFAKAHRITYTLLSDSDSRVIREFGILNTQVKPHQAPFYGIPFPGTYIVNEAGVIIEKFFHRHLAMRESVDSFVDTALGKLFALGAEPSATGGSDDIRIDVLFHGGSALKHGVQRQIVVRFYLPQGVHIYREPVPTGMVATTVTIEGPEGLDSGFMSAPPTEHLFLEVLNADLNVWSGIVDLTVPIWARDPLAPLNSIEMKQDSVDIKVNVRYQACDDNTCRIPRTETFALTIPIEPATTPRVPSFIGNANASNMRTARHFRKLILRQALRRPWLIPRMAASLLNEFGRLRKPPDRDRWI